MSVTFLNGSVQVNRFWIECLLPREGQKALGEFGCPQRALLRILEQGSWLLVGDPATYHLQVPNDDCKQIVEVVCDTASELADSLNPLRATHFLLQRFSTLRLWIKRRRAAGGQENEEADQSEGGCADGQIST
jgi:hypothetical protein